MTAIDISSKINPRLAELLGRLGPEWRRDLLSAAAESLAGLVRAHLRADDRHATAERLGALRTGRLAFAAALVTSEAGPESASVRVPLPGATRALRDVQIRPVSAPYLTLPLAAESYGCRAGDLRRLGWRLFRPLRAGGKKGGQKKPLLMGAPPGGGKAKPLYSLVDRVLQPRDPTLLPGVEEASRAVNAAVARAVKAGLEQGRGAAR